MPDITKSDRALMHYMFCDSMATVERLAEVLDCREDEVEDVVRHLAGYKPIWRPSRLRRWWYRMDDHGR